MHQEPKDAQRAPALRTKVAVGTPVTRRPPHRSQRAELPHWAPASGGDAQDLPAVCAPAHGAGSPATARGPWEASPDSPWPVLRSLLRPWRTTTLVSEASSVLRDGPTSHGRSSPAYPLGIPGADCHGGQPWDLPPSARCASMRARGLMTAQGPGRTSRERCAQCCPSLILTAEAP